MFPMRSIIFFWAFENKVFQMNLVFNLDVFSFHQVRVLYVTAGEPNQGTQPS